MPSDFRKDEDRADKARQYWDRAKVLAHRASDSESPEMRVAYLELAQQWAALAEHVRPQETASSDLEDEPDFETSQAGNPSRN